MSSGKWQRLQQQEEVALIEEDDKPVEHLMDAVVKDEDDNPMLWDEDLFQQQQRQRSYWARQGYRIAYFICKSEWFMLFMIGTLTSIAVFASNFVIEHFSEARLELYHKLPNNFLNFLQWCVIMTGSVLLSVFICTASPYAVGSGIPEMKVMFRNRMDVRLYLSFKTLMIKLVGISVVVGGGLPVGNEGPSIHIATAIANVLATNVPIFKAFINETGNRPGNRRMELLACGCAVGVASALGSPVGGMLFGVEKTTTGYMAIRNFPRGFFATVVGTTVYSVIQSLFFGKKIKAFATTDFPQQPFATVELIAYAALGLLCACVSPIFIYAHAYVFRGFAKMKNTFIGNGYILTTILVLIMAALTYPGLLGEYMASSSLDKLRSLFSSKPLHCLEDRPGEGPWAARGVYVELTTHFLIIMAILPFATTLKVPAGLFMPMFVMGATLGRLVGEIANDMFPNGLAVGSLEEHTCTWEPKQGIMKYWYPEVSIDGFNKTVMSASQKFCQWNETTGQCNPFDMTECFSMPYILPGTYAVVGAAALTAAVTRSISASVIALELTGQLDLLLPVLVGTLVGYAVALRFSPGIYDSIIHLKGLPMIPDLPRGSKYNQTAIQIMNSKVPLLSLKTTYAELASTLARNPKTKKFPLVDSDTTKVLLGSVTRADLRRALHRHLNTSRVGAAGGNMGRLSPFGSQDNLRRNESSENFDLGGDLAEVRGAKATFLDPFGNEDESDQHAAAPVASPAEQSHAEIHRVKRGAMVVNWNKVELDPTPVRVVEATLLPQIHAMFSLLNVEEVFVTQVGRVVGVITFNELTAAILRGDKGQQAVIQDAKPAEDNDQ